MADKAVCNSPINNNMLLFAAAHENALSGKSFNSQEDELGFALPGLSALFGGLMFWRKSPTVWSAFKALLDAMYASWMKLPAPARFALTGTATAAAAYPLLKAGAMARERLAFEGQSLWVRVPKKDDYHGMCVSYLRDTDIHGRRTIDLRLTDGELFSLVAENAEVRLGDKDSFGESSEVTSKWKTERAMKRAPGFGDEKAATEAIRKDREAVRANLRKVYATKLVPAAEAPAEKPELKLVPDAAKAEEAKADEAEVAEFARPTAEQAMAELTEVASEMLEALGLDESAPIGEVLAAIKAQAEAEEADEVEADEVEADEVEADEVEADEVEADEVEADEVEADAVEAGDPLGVIAALEDFAVDVSLDTYSKTKVDKLFPTTKSMKGTKKQRVDALYVELNRKLAAAKAAASEEDEKAAS